MLPCGGAAGVFVVWSDSGHIPFNWSLDHPELVSENESGVLVADWIWKILHDDGQERTWTGRNHTTGTHSLVSFCPSAFTLTEKSAKIFTLPFIHIKISLRHPQLVVRGGEIGLSIGDFHGLLSLAIER